MSELHMWRTGETLIIVLGEHTASFPFAEIVPNENTWLSLHKLLNSYL